MTRAEKIMLVVAGIFAVGSLVMILYLPANRLFTLPVGWRVALYALAGVPFLLFVKFRTNLKWALVFFWILCIVFIVSTVLFALAWMSI